MMRSHRLAAPRPRRGQPAAPPELMDDAIAEILLRLPPDEPACLVHASLVCKLWYRILSEPTFPDRYREFHRTPPLLGFLSVAYYNSRYDESAGRFKSMTTTGVVPFRQPVFGSRVLDCRHGRVLLDMVDDDTATISRSSSLAVWDPVTCDHKVLKDPYYPAQEQDDPFGRSGAVLCECHGAGPFQVVFVRTSYNYNDDGTNNNVARAWIYSSKTDAWSTPVSVQIQYDGNASVERKRAAIVGEKIYFLLSAPGAGILKYDLGKGCLTVIGSPCTYTYTLPGMLMAMEDGNALGFANVMDDFSALHLWATKLNPNGSMGWVLDSVILLNNLPVSIVGTVDTYNKVIDVILDKGTSFQPLPSEDGTQMRYKQQRQHTKRLQLNESRPNRRQNKVRPRRQKPELVGFAEGVDILLLAVEDGRGFMFEVKSERFRKLSKA